MKIINIIATIIITVTSATATAIISGGGVNLWLHEGPTRGHTIRKHVNKSKVFLLKRMKPTINTRFFGMAPMIRSTFNDYKEAKHFIDQTIDINIPKIARWFDDRDATRLAITESFGHSGTGSIGRVAYRKAWFTTKGPTPVYWGKGDGVMVILIKDARMTFGYYILTAYPTFSKSPVAVESQTQ